MSAGNSPAVNAAAKVILHEVNAIIVQIGKPIIFADAEEIALKAIRAYRETRYPDKRLKTDAE